MYKKLMVPVDLAHVDKLSLALGTAADLAKLYKIPVVYVGATSTVPSALGHNPEEYRAKLKAFADAQGASQGISTECDMVICNDPAVELDDALVKAVDEIGADVVVMATHIPNVADHFWPSNGGRLATHTDASVFLVRG